MNYKILTIDQGTTSSRSITYDINGGTIESSQYEYPLIYPEDGWVEIDPQVLMDSVIKSLNDIDKDDIELISITSDVFLASKNSPSSVIVLNPDFERLIAEFLDIKIF